MSLVDARVDYVRPGALAGGGVVEVVGVLGRAVGYAAEAPGGGGLGLGFGGGVGGDGLYGEDLGVLGWLWVLGIELP